MKNANKMFVVIPSYGAHYSLSISKCAELKVAQNTSDLIKLTNVNNVNNESIRNREHINRNIDGRTQVLQFQHVYACTCAASLLSTKARTSCELIFRTSLRFHMQRFTTKLFPELRTDSCNGKPMYTYIKCT